MTWVKHHVWLPEGTDTHIDWPHLIVCPRKHWGLVHDEVDTEQPDYPVVLVTPGAMVMGQRIRGYEWRHTPPDVQDRPDMVEWELTSLNTSIAPEFIT